MSINTFLFVLLTTTSIATSAQTKIQSDHCPLGCPSITDDNTLVIHHIFMLSNNPNTKLADWLAYEVNPTNYGRTPGRNFASDPIISPNETLEKKDYKGANSSALKSDRGHQAPLASFAGNQYWYETNYLSNITPQNKKLNQGIWKHLEIAVRDTATYSNPLYVFTGPTFTGKVVEMPNSDESHDVPDGYFKIVYDAKGSASAFHMNQQLDETENSYCLKATSIANVEDKANLLFPKLKESKSLLLALGCE